MLSELNKNHLIQRFQMHQTVDYHQEALNRVSHLNQTHLRRASVLVGFVERANGINVLFTRRAKHLKHHPGQVSFPGGKFESSDIDLSHTALRETYEEVGIEQSQIEIFGQMPELVTISRFTVTPFLGFISPNYQTRIDKNEVDEVFEVPASVVLDREKLHSQQFRVNNFSHRVFGLSYNSHFIWGMTAQIIQAMQNHIMHQH
ncbi:CoA pyrophosphatase [Vibrio europaeus]|uniref:CoA pyrophosphatase n=1 Tax=Vibrio europaeus TaxID=300876 RepID=A0A178JGE9_9VIBR|nr:CoA pyrophosphatase [Vibrio europaeus]MDC5707200.1 CoA pyrophosphatase [Vibrio europaeus]MDC5712565.1 CoA pyrophosphatase [Vibrio europaeus]MDC5717208.1 CoA pyrophosphatase [Vibrio europaeus]MDC5721258.1 CoA pyrophosphatase [Vibrio europaeus]MDC5726508.1 CoA pyrophosphatase [Vibrio europaeus]